MEDLKRILLQLDMERKTVKYYDDSSYNDLYNLYGSILKVLNNIRTQLPELKIYQHDIDYIAREYKMLEKHRYSKAKGSRKNFFDYALKELNDNMRAIMGAVIDDL